MREQYCANVAEKLRKILQYPKHIELSVPIHRLLNYTILSYDTGHQSTLTAKH